MTVSNGAQVPVVSVVILTRDRDGELAEALAGLGAQTRQPDEFVIVNNSSEETSTREVIGEFASGTAARVTELRADPAFGTASGRNAALDQSVGDIVFLLEDDLTFPDERYIEKLVEVFRSDERKAIGAVTTPAGVAPHMTVRTHLAGSARRLAKRLFGMESSRPGAVTRSGFQVRMPAVGPAGVDWLQGGATAIRGEVARAIRFDEGLEIRPLALSEDVEFGLQVGRRWRVVFTTDTYVSNGHQRRGGTATQWIQAPDRYELIVRNYDRINRRHRPGAANRLAYWWAMVGVGVDALALAAIRRSDRLGALRGYLRGLKAVMRRTAPPLPKRRIQRTQMSAGPARLRKPAP